MLDDFLSNHPYNSSQPKAFLNWIIVDEEFKKVNSSFHMGAVQVPAISGAMQKQQLTGPANMTVRRNGWLYVYVSNESNKDVYFDDLVINHKRGPVVEANNYYAFGLEIPGLASKAIGFGGNNDNRLKYNGKELQSKEFADGSGLTWDDYGARMYDPQIAKWMRPYPLAEVARKWSPYNYALDNPIRFIDPDGMWSYDANGNASTSDQAEIKTFFQQIGDNGGDKDKNKEKNNEQNKETDKEKFERLKKEFEEKYPKKVGKEEDHHIDPQYLGYPKSGPVIRLPAPYHQGITNAWREETGYGKAKKIPTGEDYEKLKEKIYNKFPLPQPDWLAIQGNVQPNMNPSQAQGNAPPGSALLRLAFNTSAIVAVMIEAAVNTVNAENEAKKGNGLQ